MQSTTFRIFSSAIILLLFLGLAGVVVWTLRTQPAAITLPTPVPAATVTATPVPTIALGEELLVSAGGFSVRPPAGYRAAVENNGASLTGSGGEALLLLQGTLLAANASLTATLVDAANELAAPLAIDLGSIQPVPARGAEAVAGTLLGNDAGGAWAGQALLMRSGENQTLLLLGRAPRPLWEAQVTREFAALADSVAFAPIPPPSTATPAQEEAGQASLAAPARQTPRSTNTAAATTATPRVVDSAPISITTILIPTPTPAAPAPRPTGNWRTISDANDMVDLAVISNTLWIATEGGALAWKQGSALPVKFTSVEGLRGNQLTAVVACPLPDLGVVFGSNQGLQIFAPATGTWRRLDPGNSPMHAQDVTALYCDPANEFLVIGYAAHGIDLFDSARNNWQHLDRSSGLAANDVQQVAVVGDRDQLWVVAKDGVTVADGPDSTFFTVDNSPLVSNTIGAITTDRTGSVWLGGEGVVYQVEGESWNVYDADRVEGSPFPTGLITGLAVAPDGALWIGDRGGAICRFDPQASRCTDFFRSAPGMAAGPVTQLRSDDAGRIFYTTGGNGYSVYDGQQWRTFTKADDLLDGNAVTALTQDADGQLWVATHAGVQRFDAAGRQSAQFDAGEIGMPPASIRALLPTDAGGMWVAGQGASYFDGRTWERLTVADGLAGSEVYAAAVDEQQRTWFGTDDGLSIWNGQQFFNITGERGLPSSQIRALAADGPVMWIGALGGGLYRFENNELQILNRRNTGLPSDNITALAVADRGLWIGSDQGVARLQDDVVTVSREMTAPVTALSASGDTLWAATATQGVYVFDGATWTQYTAADALPADAVAALLAGADRAWVGGRTGGLVEYRQSE